MVGAFVLLFFQEIFLKPLMEEQNPYNLRRRKKSSIFSAYGPNSLQLGHTS